MTLTEVLSTILELDPSEIDNDLSRTTHAAWTSLRHVQLIATVEELGEVSFTSREMAAIDSVRQLRELLAAKGIPPNAELSS
jgi:acyl carrier protein